MVSVDVRLPHLIQYCEQNLNKPAIAQRLKERSQKEERDEEANSSQHRKTQSLSYEPNLVAGKDSGEITDNVKETQQEMQK